MGQFPKLPHAGKPGPSHPHLRKPVKTSVVAKSAFPAMPVQAFAAPNGSGVPQQAFDSSTAPPIAGG